MKVKDIKLGQPYFYQKGTAAWRQQVNGDGAVYVLSTDTFVHPSSYDRARGIAPFVRQAEYRGRHRGTGMLAIIVTTNVHHGDIPREVREIVVSMTEAQTAQVAFKVPQYIRDELREYSCHAEIELVRPQALVGDWDEIYSARKREAREKFEGESALAEMRRRNTERWQDAAVEIADLLDESTVFLPGSARPGDVAGETRSIGIDVLEKLIRLAQDGRSHRLLTDASEELPGMDPL